jgi:selenobiotic family peptide radical SAM maturase
VYQLTLNKNTDIEIWRDSVPTFYHDTYQKIFTNCHRILGSKTWGRILAALDGDPPPQIFPDKLISLTQALALPDFIVDLARIELAMHQVRSDVAPFNKKIKKLTVNPTLVLVPVSWENLVAVMAVKPGKDPGVQEAAGIHVIIWRHPKTGKIHIRESEDIDLLALKITIEEIDVREAAAIGGVTVGAIESARHRAISQGILISPESLIRREITVSTDMHPDLESYISADIFTLQWHITQTCDLHCKHCYDRSERTPIPYDAALDILDDFYEFCQETHVRGQITFTGGNPLLYPHFLNIYKEASERGFGTAILGNPSPIRQIEKLMDIAKPLYFQISLEGLESHNDDIRGNGHFKRSLAFLDHLKSLEIYTMVMLTLSRDNIHHVLPLAELLGDRADFFTFNRLSTVGEGARLLMADPKVFQTFLGKYDAAYRENPIIGLKDNLFNIIRKENNSEPFGGCTGYGCGAAFNFVALLPDGEVHACRKFPSPIGNIKTNRLTEIYHSKLARKYRKGSQACRDCSLNLVCRGCPAITYSYGLDVFKEKDPFCFVR